MLHDVNNFIGTASTSFRLLFFNEKLALVSVFRIGRKNRSLPDFRHETITWLIQLRCTAREI